MTKLNDYTSFELMATAGARELNDGEVVAVGLGLPVVSAFLAKRTHAPHITIVLELGVVDPEPLDIGNGLSDPRFWYRAKCHTSFADMLGMVLHRGLVDVGFLGTREQPHRVHELTRAGRSFNRDETIIPGDDEYGIIPR